MGYWSWSGIYRYKREANSQIRCFRSCFFLNSDIPSLFLSSSEPHSERFFYFSWTFSIVKRANYKGPFQKLCLAAILSPAFFIIMPSTHEQECLFNPLKCSRCSRKKSLNADKVQWDWEQFVIPWVLPSQLFLLLTWPSAMLKIILLPFLSSYRMLGCHWIPCLPYLFH